MQIELCFWETNLFNTIWIQQTKFSNYTIKNCKWNV